MERKSTVQKVAGVVIGLSLIAMAALAFWSMGNLLGPFQEANSIARFTLLDENKDALDLHYSAWALIGLLDLVVSIALMVYYHSVNPTRAVLTGGVRILYTVVLIVALSSLRLGFGHFYPELSTEQFMEVCSYLDEFFAIWNLGLIVFGVHLILWGRLVPLSSITNKILMVLLILGGLGYLVTSVGPLLYDSYPTYAETLQSLFMIPMVLGELGIGMSILIRSFHSK